MSKGVKKKGFTLVELVVVLAIFGLLASITGLGLYSWTRYSINKENNENARTIFLAAQESLTHMQASGTLDTLNFSNVDNTDVQGIINNNPELEPTLSTYGNRLKTFYYVPTNKSGLVYDLLKPYLEGTGIFDGSIAIEMDPVDGVVYSVFYSKKATSFYYETRQDLNESGQVGICKRDPGTLKDRLLGFYSTNLTLPKPTQLPVAYIESNEPLSAETQLINAEELYYIISFDDLGINNKSELLSSNTSFEIDIYDPNVSAPMIKIQTTGTKLNSINNGLVSYTIYYKKNDNNGGGDGQYKTQIEMNLRTEISDEDKYIKVVFDSIDVNTVNKLTKSDITFSYDGTKINGFKNYDDSFSDTYSIFNLLRGLKEKNSEIRTVGFDSFYCKYKIKIGDVEKAAQQPSNTENYLFKSFKENEDNSIYIEISNIRHLFNICYIEKINTANNTTNRKITYKQVNSFDYYGNYIFSSINSYASPTIADGFPTIKKFGSKSTYDASENSNSNYSINKLVLNSKVLDSYTDESQNSIYKYNLGIFAENYGTIKNLELIDASLINKKSNGNKSNNTTNGSGIITAVNMNNGTIENCKVSGKINGEMNIGGIAGINFSKIIDCTSEVLISAQNKESYNLGGIAGLVINTDNHEDWWFDQDETRIQAVIQNCTYIPSSKVTDSLLNQELDPFLDYLNGYQIGGIAGKTKGVVQIKDCKTITSDEGYIIGYNSVGGIIGICDNRLRIKSSIENGFRSVYNEANVIGVDCVGGVIANIANGNSNNIFSNLENRGAIVVMKTIDNNGNPVGSYGGGITAYININTTLENCLSNVTETTIKDKLVKDFSNGDCVGGITGDQRGTILSDSIVYHNVLVGGGDNIGGLVGKNSTYNNNPSLLKNQSIAGGYVYGDNYVGGVIGCNYKAFSNGDLLKNNIDSVIGKGNYIGGIFGVNNGDLHSNVSIKQTIGLIQGTNYVGGIAGYNDKQIQNYYVEANIEASGDNIGGIAGYSEGSIYSGEVQYSKVNVSGENYVGGIIGFLENGKNLENQCVKGFKVAEYAKIVGKGDYIGGIAGYSKSQIYSNRGSIINYVDVTGNNQVGGIAGYTENDIQKNYVYGSINGKENVGGIAGYTKASIYSEDAQCSLVNVSGVKNVGGIAGKTEGSQINKQYVSGLNDSNAIIHAAEDNVGGIVGWSKAGIYSENVQTSHVNVEGRSNVGGIVGYSEGSQINNQCVSGVNGTTAKIQAKGDNVGGMIGFNSNTDIYSSNLVFNVDIQGNNNVGGLIGYNENGSKQINSQIISERSIIKGINNVGGYIGKANLGNNSIGANINNITVIGKTNVGGIIGEANISNNAVQHINWKVDHINVSGVNSENIGFNVGGVFGGVICDSSCSIKATVKDTTVSGKNNVAGILPIVENNVTINGSLIENSHISTIDSLNENDNISVGIVSSVNKGNIDNTTVKDSDIDIARNNIFAGYITGINENTVSNCKVINNETLLNHVPLTYSDNLMNQGDIAGINGSVKVLENDSMALINNSRAVYKTKSEETIHNRLAGTNIANIKRSLVYSNTDQNKVNSAITGNIPEQDINIRMVKNDDSTFKFIFKPAYGTYGSFKFLLYGISLSNGVITEFQLLSDLTTDTENSEISLDTASGEYYYIYNNSEDPYNCFKVAVDYIGDSSNAFELISHNESCFFDVLYIETLSANKTDSYNFDIAWTTQDYQKNYISGYELRGKVSNNNSEAEIVLNNSIPKDLSTIKVALNSTYQDSSGNSISLQDYNRIKFGLIAKAVGNQSIYIDSEIKWTDWFDIEMISQTSNLELANEGETESSNSPGETNTLVEENVSSESEEDLNEE